MDKYTDEQLMEIADSTLRQAVKLTEITGESPAYVQARVNSLTQTGKLALKILKARHRN